MKFSVTTIKNYIFSLLLLLFTITSCNKDFNTVGYTLFTTDNFKTDKIKLPVHSSQEKIISEVQTNGGTILQLGDINIPNIGKSSAYIISQLNLNPTARFGVYTAEQERDGDPDNIKVIEENETVVSAYLEIPFLYNQTDTDSDGVIDIFDSDPNDPTSDSDGDSITDAVETNAGTNPLSNDSDGDGILDADDEDNSGYQVENRVYDVDSIFGNRNASFNLKIDELTYYLNDLDPNNNFETSQNYYSSRDLYKENFVGENLYDGTYKLNFDEIRVNYEEDDEATTDVDETTLVENRRSPRIRVPLKTDFFQKKFLDIEGSDSLAVSTNFKKYIRGIFIRMENPSDDLYMLLNFSGANITVTYKYDSYNDNDTADDTTDDTTEQIKRTFILTPSLSVNYLENSLSNPQIEQAAEQKESVDKLFVKGGLGLLSSIELFGNIEDGSADTKLAELRKNNWLINEANLVFYVDPSSVKDWKKGDLIADRLYLYNRKSRTPLKDYLGDITTNGGGNDDKFVFGGILEYKNEIPHRYKFKITQHINDIIRNDSTNVALSLTVLSNINDPSTREAKILENGKEEEIFYPTASILNPLGSILIGSNPKDEFKDLKLELELIYTDYSKN